MTVTWIANLSPKKSFIGLRLFIYYYFYFINFASQAGRAPQQLAPITVAPFLPSQPWYTTEDRPQHRELRALLLATSVWVLLRPTGLWTLKGCETGPPAYRPYPRRLESLTICRCSFKGSTFSSVILRPWVLVRPELNSRPPAWQAGAQPSEPPVRRNSHGKYVQL